MIRYLLDENVPVAYRTELQRQNPMLEVRVIGGEDAPRKRTPDPDILIWCEEHGFTFLYYLHNKENVSAYMEDYWEWQRNAREEYWKNPHPTIARLAELMAQKQAEEGKRQLKKPEVN